MKEKYLKILNKPITKKTKSSNHKRDKIDQSGREAQLLFYLFVNY